MTLVIEFRCKYKKERVFDITHKTQILVLSLEKLFR